MKHVLVIIEIYKTLIIVTPGQGCLLIYKSFNIRARVSKEMRRVVLCAYLS